MRCTQNHYEKRQPFQLLRLSYSLFIEWCTHGPKWEHLYLIHPSSDYCIPTDVLRKIVPPGDTIILLRRLSVECTMQSNKNFHASIPIVRVDWHHGIGTNRDDQWSDNDHHQRYSTPPCFHTSTLQRTHAWSCCHGSIINTNKHWEYFLLNVLLFLWVHSAYYIPSVMLIKSTFEFISIACTSKIASASILKRS